MSFPRYPKYKASGVEWLGDVPAHWAIPLIKRTTYLKARVGWKGLTSEEFRDNAFAYLVTGSDFRGKFVEWDKCYQVERDRYEDDPFIQLENGDLLITKDGTIGKLAIVSGLDRPACLNSGIFVARPRNTYSTPFMYWILSSRVFSVFCDLKSFGCTINHLYQNVLEQFAFPAPPESEQTAIAAFLDRETAKIDGLVAEQRRLMELLKEKRQAVISHAVTKGLNPSAKMKPSGVEWLGDVPEGWGFKPLKHLGSIISGFAFKSTDFKPQGVRVLKIANIQTRVIDWSDDSYLPDDFYDKHIQFAVKDGDVVFALTRPIISTGLKAAIANIGSDRVLLNQRNAIFRPSEWLNKKFLYYILFCDSFKSDFLNRIDFTGLQPNISPVDISNIKVLFPSTDDQSAIAKFLDFETAEFDTLTAEAQRAIDLLQERRTALISAAVTGQIDVRNQPRN